MPSTFQTRIAIPIPGQLYTSMTYTLGRHSSHCSRKVRQSDRYWSFRSLTDCGTQGVRPIPMHRLPYSEWVTMRRHRPHYRYSHVCNYCGHLSHAHAACGTGSEQRHHDATCNSDYAGDHTQYSQRLSRKDGGELVGGQRVATPQSKFQVCITL